MSENNDYETPTPEELEGALIDMEAQILDLNKKLQQAGVGSVRDDDTPIIIPAEDFEQTVTDIRKRDNCTRTVALAKARHEAPDAFEAYEGGPDDQDFDTLVAAEIQKGSPAAVAGQRVLASNPNLASTVIAKAGKTPFETEVDNIQEQDGCSRSEAMARARKKEPTKFQHYQEA